MGRLDVARRDLPDDSAVSVDVLWQSLLHMTHGSRDPDRDAWLTLAIGRVFKRFS